MKSELKTKQKITEVLRNFANDSFEVNSLDLLKSLGYYSENTIDAVSLEEFIDTFDSEKRLNNDNALLGDWQSIKLLFQLTGNDITGSGQLWLNFDTGNTKVNNSIVESYLFLAIALQKGSYTRTELSKITREINKLFPMPVMIVFQHGDTLTLSMINRRLNKRDESKDVLEKVTLIKDINCANPHRAHIEILFDLSLEQLNKTHGFTNFVDLHNAWQKTLNISELNQRFFKEIANWYFWAVQNVIFPEGAGEDVEIRNATSVIRLITRLIFVWFLKEKGLVPDSLFNEHQVQVLLKSINPQESSFYKAILQNLFFATLNQEMNTPKNPDNRKFRNKAKQAGGRHQNYMIHNIYRYEDYLKNPEEILSLFEEIPFLNGGLFECLDKQNQNNPKQIIRIDGFSDRQDNQLQVPNFLFFADAKDIDLNEIYGTKNKRYTVQGLINILNRYKFTINENTPIEEEIALDPELLGKVFENLLAAYNPETNTTARKQTGSFYTPREIVHYMVDESLLAYLETEIAAGGEYSDEWRRNLNQRLRHLFAYNREPHQFNEITEVPRLIDAIDKLKILDPACGSGAFPMGILHKLVLILGKLDPQNRRWKEKQIAKINEVPDSTIREKVIEDIEQAFERNELDYGRKLYLIESCLYGVDIQPIAVQIAKLRFFISLIVDQKVDSTKENRGIRPLPNLETKFVAANALIGIQKEVTLRSPEIIQKEQDLASIRRKYFAARTPKTKRECREKDDQLRREISELLIGLGLPGIEADTLARWNPYAQNVSADFFDAEWMFGVNDGFDICIGNPPYVRQEQIKELKPLLKKQYDCYTGVADLYVYFYERAFQLLKNSGILIYISSNKYFRAGYGEKLRKFLSSQTKIHELIDFGDAPVFTAIAYPCIIMASKVRPNAHKFLALTWEQGQPIDEFASVFQANSFLIPQKELTSDGWQLESSTVLRLLEKLRKAGKPLGEYVNGRFYRGILTGLNEAFVVDRATRDKLIAEDESSADVLKPFVRGRDVKRWQIESPDLWIIFTRRGINIKKYPAIHNYLLQFQKRLTPGLQGSRKKGNYKWYEIQDNIAYYLEFEQPKIIYPDIASNCEFAIDKSRLFPDCTLFMVPEGSLYLLGILNSKLTQFFFKQISPNVRGNFMRFKSIYVQQIPIPEISNPEPFETLVDYIIYFHEQLKDKPSYGSESMKSARDKMMTRFFEQIIDGMVYEIYLPEELHKEDRYFAKYVCNEKLPQLESIKGDKMQALREIFERLFYPEHPIRKNLFFLDSLEVIRTIEGKA